MKRISGRYERNSTGGETVSAFIPEPLPPRDPPLLMYAGLADSLSKAESALSRLDAAGTLVPSINWFIYSFVRKEAVISSQIEGTQATLIDLFAYEASGKSDIADEAEVMEICNYLDALGYARKQLKSKKGLPLSMRLLNETHRRLMKGVRGEEKRPGEIRRSQNWIGGTRPGNALYVPPPPHALGETLGQLEKFIHSKNDIPPLAGIGLLHLQFETIHPYLDGNGRIGRLLITLLLEERRFLDQPLLYLSLFFKRHRAEYYRLLNAARTEGDFEGWLKFFFEGVRIIADEAVATIKALFGLVSTDRTRILAAPSSAATSVRLFEMLPEHPIVTIGGAIRLLDTTKPTAAKAVNALVRAGVLIETTGRRRDRIFSYAAYLDLLRAGTEMEIGGRRRL